MTLDDAIARRLRTARAAVAAAEAALAADRNRLEIALRDAYAELAAAQSAVEAEIARETLRLDAPVRIR